MAMSLKRALGAGVMAGMVLLAGCAGHRPRVENSAPLSGSETSGLKAPPAATVSAIPEPSKKGAEVAAHAAAMAKTGKLPKTAKRDCSGFVLAAYRAAGTPLSVPVESQRERNLSAMLHDWSVDSHCSFRKGDPAPGDLVFFRDTIADRGVKNHVTHVALVESVDEDGTVQLIHYMGGKIRRDAMNLARPKDPAKNGWLRKKQHAGDPVLAGELFVAYARFE
jgi:hypothetical protein